jgi:formylglycine-generating enzyme required for sulfatase activity
MPRFFTELLKHGEVDRAMSAARASVVHRHDWWMPVLFSHLQDNQLFKPPTGGIAQSVRILHYEPKTVYIPAGTFLMGANKKVAVEAFESPMHEVNLPAFRIGCYPVTNAEFSEFIRQTGRLIPITAGWEGQYPPVNKLTYPIAGITWYDAVAYCRWLSEQTGRNYGLPSEAQWEKAARGMDWFVYPWGDEWEDERCNFGNFTVTPVDAFPAQNEYGCFDLVGNVRQWTCSLWGERRLAPDPRYAYPWKMDGRNNLDAERHIRRVCRGGGVLDEISAMRCCAKSSYLPYRHGPPGNRIGFRIVLHVDET